MEVEVREAKRVDVDEDIRRQSQALHSFLTGQLAYEREDYKTAMASYSEASSLLPEPVAVLHSRLAELHLREGHLDQALEESEKALQAEPDNVQNQLLRAGILEAKGRTDEALAGYAAVAQTHPEMLEASILLASLYEDRGELDKGVVVLEALVQRRPDEPLLYYYLGRAREKQGDLAAAEQHYKKTLDLAPVNFDPSIDLMRVYLKKKDATALKELCEKLLKTNPGHVVARKVLGELLLGENKLDEALEHLKVLEQKESDSATRFRIAAIQIQKQNYPEAIRELNLILAQEPSFTEARYQLASIFAGTGRGEEAVTELMKIKRGDPLYAKSRTFAAFLLRQQGDFKKAEKIVRELIADGQNDKQTVSFLILILRDARKYDQAIAVVRGALEKNPSSEPLLYTLGGLQHDAGREDQAVATMEQLITINPKHPEALNFIAYSLAEQGKDLDRALALINQAVALRPDEGFFMDTLAWVYFKQGNLDQAEATIRQAITLSGQDAEVIEHYGDILRARVQSDAALEQYRLALEKLHESTDLAPEQKKDRERRLEDKLREAAPVDSRAQ